MMIKSLTFMSLWSIFPSANILRLPALCLAAWVKTINTSKRESKDSSSSNLPGPLCCPVSSHGSAGVKVRCQAWALERRRAGPCGRGRHHITPGKWLQFSALYLPSLSSAYTWCADLWKIKMKKDDQVMVGIIETEERTVNNVAGHRNKMMIAVIQVDNIECRKLNQHQLADTQAVL